MDREPLIPSLSCEEREEKITSIHALPVLNIPQEETERVEATKKIDLLEITLKNHQEQQEQLAKDLASKKEELEKLAEENKQMELNAFQIAQDFADYKLFTEEQLKQKNMQLVALQQNLEDQRTEMEKRQDQIYQLDTKVHDLSYEIKTLLFLNQEEPISPKPVSFAKEKEKPSTFAKAAALERFEPPCAVIGEENEGSYAREKPIQTAQEAAALLKKCINMAQKLTGANYHTSEASRYREFSTSNYAIDQRRLFDALRNENGALIIVYSQKENKILFANSETKVLLGWSSEKFVADFASIMHEGMSDWRKALSSLVVSSEAQARLLAKTKQGQEVILTCHLGLIPTGLFRNYVIGVLYPT